MFSDQKKFVVPYFKSFVNKTKFLLPRKKVLFNEICVRFSAKGVKFYTKLIYVFFLYAAFAKQFI